ncbi:MAG TPA: D-alanine--D-alanine ligase family protein [Chloroflexota bacterium]|nr:D-alanine--D-alanine ligase family protein [Chloroflexota bacterium]
MTGLPPRRVRLALLFGGRSPEHDVSLTSARSVLAALDPARFEVALMAIGRDGRWLPGPASQGLLSETTPVAGSAVRALDAGGLVPDANLGAMVDVVFPLLHGPFGEDGTVQGLLELLNLPYVGAGVVASATGMDKALMKALFLQRALPVLPHRVLTRHSWVSRRDAILQMLRASPGFPCFVKPSNMGSSIGVSRVDTVDALGPALDVAFQYDLKVLVEQGVPGYREIECGVLGNDAPTVSVPGEITMRTAFYDYHTKYTEGEASLEVPARVRPETATALQAMALEAFAAIDCAGMARVDFLVSPDESEIWVSEINTIPGFTPYSMYPRLWEASGLSYPDLITRLVELALERHEARASLLRDRIPTREG